MRKDQIYSSFQAQYRAGKKQFVVLIDPDHAHGSYIKRVKELAQKGIVDCFFVGGSLMVNNMLDSTIVDIKKEIDIPIILFPGSTLQVSYRADALLYLSLISGRNPDLLIGKHVETAPFLKLSPLEILSTGYMLIDGGVPTTVSYMSNTYPIPNNKVDIAVCTAIAGEMLGLKMIFMDAGSGAKTPVTAEMIEAVNGATDIPLIVGGGIRTPERAAASARAGADLIVVGNAIEKDPGLIEEMAAAVHEQSAGMPQ